jgi:hypothetical protein
MEVFGNLNRVDNKCVDCFHVAKNNPFLILDLLYLCNYHKLIISYSKFEIKVERS